MPARIIAVLLAAIAPTMVSAAWTTVASEQGKRVEIDRSSIANEQNGTTTAKGRIVLDRPIVDPKTSAAYRIIEIESRYDCAERTHATLMRTYYKEEGELLRQEEVRSPFEMPVRSGTPDDRLLREACRPKGTTGASPSVNETLDKISEVAGDLRKSNDALVAQAVKKDLQRFNTRADARLPGSAVAAKRNASGSPAPRSKKPQQTQDIDWSYEGRGNPELWGRLRPEYATCATGRRQAPIDIRDGFAVDLEPIQFFYKPANFSVSDNMRHLHLSVHDGGLMLLGQQYRLTRIRFHSPSEFTVNGRAYDMEAQLLHESADGKLAIVSVFLEKGNENAVLQNALNNFPLEKGGAVTPPAQNIDVNALLPETRGYFTFMGSLTTPPCTEDVLWLVLKQPQQISPDQLSIFRRLYRPNARPVQPSFGRIIKESR